MECERGVFLAGRLRGGSGTPVARRTKEDLKRTMRGALRLGGGYGADLIRSTVSSALATACA